jgi:signal transduction histidine kinase
MTSHGEPVLSKGILDARSWSPWKIVTDPLSWRSALYLLFGFGLGFAWFVILVTGISVAAGLLIVWVGVLVAAVLMLLWRGGAMLERRILRFAFGVSIPDPYRPMPPVDGGPVRRLLQRWRVMATDPATWKDLVYLGLLFPITLVEFCASILLWSLVGLFALAPLIVAGNMVATGDHGMDIALGAYDVTFHNPVATLPLVPLGLGLGLIALYVVRMMAIMHASIARALLGPSENQRLRTRTAQLQSSRARGVDAAESERRRIERDLHDGAQQQLLAVAMNIGRARAKLDSDPEGARALIEEAHAGARDAIAELRNLARGIYPAILTDRGLDAALSALAARSDTPVEVVVDLPTRPPAAVESIAYFIVAESLVNISKYARATSASVSITRDPQWVIVEIADNGVGGAKATPGGGLAGLADRAATIDGILTVNSPVGGPTVVRADLPCTW